MLTQLSKLGFAIILWFHVGLQDRNCVLLGAFIPASGQEETTQAELQDPARSENRSEKEPDSERLIYSSNFASGLDEWEFSDAKAWKLDRIQGSNEPILRQSIKASNYKSKYRSPFHQAILKDQQFESFELTVEVRSSHASYGHRDVCLFFGYQNPNQFYYVHLGQETDAHCNQIFIVNNADRTKISLTTNEGTPWDENWHQVRIVRHIESGKIEVYFDDQTKPVMTAEDKTFAEGRIGIGSFDDTADWAKLRVRKLEQAARVETPHEGTSPATVGQ